MRQLPLPGLEPFRPAAPADSTAADAGRTQEPAPDILAEQQLWLFSGPAVLLRELEYVIRAGDFEAAARVSGRLQAEYGPSPLTRSLETLERLDAGLWRRPPGEILDAWAEIDAGLDGHPWLRRRVRVAALGRVLSVHPGPEVVRQRPQYLAALCNTLHEAGAPVTSARGLVRDALLRGRALDPRDFEDAAVKDLLAEDREPAWLACLGAILRVWPVPPPSQEDLLDLEDWVTRPEALGVTETEAARAFWLCLLVADSTDHSAELVHEARKAMKQLDAGLHGLYMARLRPSW